tara:strand:- start:2811 stop:8378 length:5568 start_codon:yes stop_codon:yes gene_type:complete
MAEIRHTFQGGKMNKDLDERLVPQGEYRDALNIEVRTSGDGNIGAVQNLYGNIGRLSSIADKVEPTVNGLGSKSCFVGSIANERTNKAYFFIASPTHVEFRSGVLLPSDITTLKLYKDMIIEYDNIARAVKPVCVDIWRMEIPVSTVGSIGSGSASDPYNSITMTGSVDDIVKNIRPGMQISFYKADGSQCIDKYQGDVSVEDNGLGSIKVLKVDGSTIYFDRYVIGDLSSAVLFTVTAVQSISSHKRLDRSLNFHQYKSGGVVKNIITGINIIDDLLFWTDNIGEPKKISISRSIAGSTNFDTHTSLMISDPNLYDQDNLVSLNEVDPNTSSGLIEQHVTVIKRAPRTAPKLEMSEYVGGENNIQESILLQWSSGVYPNAYGLEANSHWFTLNFAPNGTVKEPGDMVQIATGPNFIFNQGDRIELYQENSNADGGEYSIVVKVLDRTSTQDFGVFYDVEIDLISSDIPDADIIWKARSYDGNRKDPYFQLKFGRFGYRYKYQDGEYSPFSPWSELAFIPGKFDYVPKKGFNLGMVNNVRELRVTDFIVDDALRPDDVVEVDILYKDTVSPNVYIVKSIRRSRDYEWNEKGVGSYRGVLDITSEMIHRTLESSQSLRAWDNVPRKALAQEVTGNRIVYGNYVQNYNIDSPVFVKQSFISAPHPGSDGSLRELKTRKSVAYKVPDLASVSGSTGVLDNSNITDKPEEHDLEFSLTPSKSLKSIRKYRIGVVFGDKYGRETPVIGLGGLTERDPSTSQLSEKYPDSVNVGKEFCANVNKLTAQLEWKGTKPANWMEYYKFYVKETSNEYYNMVQDRWYDAEDGNVWLSFQSADRNKVDIETYLILKNEHGSQKPVFEKARYKILAISNEAPDFIKTTNKILGAAPVQTSSELVNSMVVSFDPDVFTDSFGSVEDPIKFKGIGYGRLRGIEGDNLRYSDWVKISRINNVTHTVTLMDPFGDSANFAEAFGLSDYGSLDSYEFEIKDAVVENRPEFDGKFFIKIYKDALLTTKVLDTTDDGLTYGTVNQLKHSYVRSGLTNAEANSGATYQGNYAGVASPSPGELSNNTTGDKWSHTNGFTPNTGDGGPGKMAFCGHKDNTKKFWKWYDDEGPAKGGLPFIDQARNAGSGGSPGDISKGIYNSELYPQTGLNAIRWAAMGDKRFSQSGPAKELYDLLSQEGTLFRFSGDPLKIVYQVQGSGDEHFGSSAYYNYHRTCSSRCNETGVCRRSFFRMYFHQKNDPSKGLDNNVWDPRSSLMHDGTGVGFIEVVEAHFDRAESPEISQGNAIWETEPKEDVGLDLYYEATDAIPMYLRDENIQSFIPLGASIRIIRNGTSLAIPDLHKPLVVRSAVRDVISIGGGTNGNLIGSPHTLGLNPGDILQFTHADGTITQTSIISHWHELDSITDADYKPSSWGNSKIETGYYRLKYETYDQPLTLSWFNCYSFGNGIESDRIRDDFNAPTIDNGCKVSSTLDTFGEEHRSSGMIWSGIYNSTSGVNRLNEFNMANPITKDLNPSYGSLQAMKTRDTNVVAFCEDKVFKILANKDALFNADGSSNVTASNAVLGDASGFSGDYGISSNPESLAVDSYRMYFTDKQRNKVLRLSQDGLTPISDVGMVSYFRDNLDTCSSLIGTFDEIKGEYNLSLIRKRGSSLSDTTVSFNEKTKGWVSFKSFVPETGLSINDEYVTGKITDNTEKVVWSHHHQETDSSGDLIVSTNTFYGEDLVPSTVDVIFNQSPEVVKGFTSMNYEGTQARVTGYESLTGLDVNNNSVTQNNNNYMHLSDKEGWFVSSIYTDLQEASVPDFIDKENKWFNYIKGTSTTLSNLDTKEFSVQGIGTTAIVSSPLVKTFTLTIQENND